MNTKPWTSHIFFRTALVLVLRAFLGLAVHAHPCNCVNKAQASVCSQCPNPAGFSEEKAGAAARLGLEPGARALQIHLCHRPAVLESCLSSLVFYLGNGWRWGYKDKYRRYCQQSCF